MVESPTNTSTLVLLHGWGLNQQVWSQLLPQLPPQQPVLALNIPGFGGSQAPAPYQLELVLDQLASQIPQQSVLVGWSLGGLLALLLASRHPAKVKTLGLVASSPKFLKGHDWPGMEGAVMRQFAQSLQQDLAGTVERFLAIQAMGSSSARQDMKQLRQAVLSLPLPTAPSLEQGLHWLAELDAREQLAALPHKVFGLYGRLDSLVPAAVLPLLQQLRPDADWTLLDKASHAPFISHPDYFLSWVLKLLAVED